MMAVPVNVWQIWPLVSSHGQRRPVPWRTVNVPSRELTPEDVELIEFARAIVDANTDGEDGVHTMGAAVRGVDATDS
jgi:hypothetical protein